MMQDNKEYVIVVKYNTGGVAAVKVTGLKELERELKQIQCNRTILRWFLFRPDTGNRGMVALYNQDDANTLRSALEETETGNISEAGHSILDPLCVDYE